MLHRAEEWKILRRAPKLKLVKEYGRALRLDAATERKLLDGAPACEWQEKTLERFSDILILMRDTGMRNERELYRVRIENIDWQLRREHLALVSGNRLATHADGFSSAAAGCCRNPECLAPSSHGVVPDCSG
jgi:hypothetical protein